MNKLLFFLIPFMIATGSCDYFHKGNGNHGGETPGGIEFDTVSLHLDTMLMQHFFLQHAVGGKYIKDARFFYAERGNTFAWINSSGVNEYARNFINLLNHEETIHEDDCILFSAELQELFWKIAVSNYAIKGSDSAITALELLLTLNFFEYAKRNWRSLEEDELRKLGWYIQRPQLSYRELLDSVLKSEPHNISSYDPLYRQYGLLKKFLLKYKKIEDEGEWLNGMMPDSELRVGDTAILIPSIKRKLFILEDLATDENTSLFTADLESAVRKFQRRNGLKENGLLSKETISALAVPLHDRIHQLLINMERCRWVPKQQEGEYIVVNIPDFKLYLLSNDSLEWSCNVIVGKSNATSNTVVFNANLDCIVFNPYWNVPENILVMETLPEIRKDPGYLAKRNMEVVDRSGKIIPLSSIQWSRYTTHFPYIVRQRPGKNNTLGRIKFLFPNPYDIYMHDTPERSLFNETSRAFSHGCIRLDQPYQLASLLLRKDSLWNEDRMDVVLKNGEETFVRLKNKIPVFIAYFTAWVDREGKLNFRDDIYHHDERMKQLLFSEKN